MEVKYMRIVTSHHLEHPRLVLPETNLFPEKENVRLVKGCRRTIFLGYIRENLKPHLEVVGTLKSCNNIECQREIFLENRKLSDLQEERSTKSPVVLWRVHKPTKKSVWLTNQRIPYWLQYKSAPRHPGI